MNVGNWVSTEVEGGEIAECNAVTEVDWCEAIATEVEVLEARESGNGIFIIDVL